jgi:uncharacterized Zn-finger protein
MADFERSLRWEGEPQAPLATAPRRHNVTRAELPLHCPTAEMGLWNGHPRVYLPIEKSGQAVCPYCGAEYVLEG